jgi:predicted AlkP superfamily phosphohydrolase/phosphomutase
MTKQTGACEVASHSEPTMAIRQLVICVDAMEWDLVRLWAAQGKLPILRHLMDHGASAELSTTAAQLPDTVWTSMVTGLNPAKLEKYFYVQYEGASLGLRYVSDEVVTAVPVWSMLSAAGVQVGVADIPHVALSRSLNGFQVSNWGTHGPGGAQASNPPELLKHIQHRFGSHPVGDCDACDETPSKLSDLRDRILAGVRKHGELFRWLMAREPCDVFFASFSGSHCIGHHFWRFADGQHPRHVADKAANLSEAIEQVYRAIDREMGAMITAAGEGVRCIVVSGHGMGPVFHASWNLTEILALLGYGKSAGVAKAQPNRTARVNPWRLLKRILPGRLQYAIRNALPESLRHRLLFLWYAGGQDWKECRAFAVPNNDTVGAIRVSVKGRDKHGLVEHGSEYECVCRDIAVALRELKDPQSGRPVVRKVTIIHEEFSGPFVNLLPDITVLWDQSFPWKSLQSPRFGTLRVRRQDARSGSHTAHGFALFHGPGIRAGPLAEGHSIYDIAPTILAEAGVGIPLHLDGRPIPLD